jgi:hypothetical protein
VQAINGLLRGLVLLKELAFSSEVGTGSREENASKKPDGGSRQQRRRHVNEKGQHEAGPLSIQIIDSDALFRDLIFSRDQYFAELSTSRRPGRPSGS